MDFEDSLTADNVMSGAVKAMSKVIRLSPLNGLSNGSALALATQALTAGRIIAVPTDTIYGLAVAANNSAAIKRLYELKGRVSTKPVAICVAEIPDIGRWCDVTVSDHLLRDLLPGAVTLVFGRSDQLNAELNPDHPLVGVRIPDHSFVRDLCDRCGPLGLTSANVSSESSCLAVDEFRHLWPELSAVFDGGPLGHEDPERLGSTVVDLSVPKCFKIIRDGCALHKTLDVLQNKHQLKRLFE